MEVHDAMIAEEELRGQECRRYVSDDHVAVSGCDALRFNNKACRSAWQCAGH